MTTDGAAPVRTEGLTKHYKDVKALVDLDWREMGMMLPMVAMTFVIGVAPRPFLARIDPAIGAVVERLEDARQTAALASEPEAVALVTEPANPSEETQ